MCFYEIGITMVVHYFDLCGFYSEFQTINRRLKVKLLILHCIIGTLITIATVHYIIQYVNDVLGSVNDSVKMFGALLVYFSSIIEFFSKRKCQRNFWNIHRSIGLRFCAQRKRFPREYFWKFAYLPIISIFYAIFYTHIAIQRKMYFWVGYSFILIMYQHRTFYYLFYLELIRIELNTINDKLKKMHLSTSKESTTERFKWICEYYENVYGLCECTNDIFGWSNVFTIIYSFQIVTTHLNWVYWIYYKSNGNFIVEGGITANCNNITEYYNNQKFFSVEQ